MKKHRHPYTAAALTPRRMAGLMMALSVIAMVVGHIVYRYSPSLIWHCGSMSG
ncbi:MAG: hypothetical protein IJ498_04290 [Akkermansia sp.]|nr:hypothetical protein [Akkermansia sp.]